MQHDFDDLAMSLSNGGSRRLIVKRLALSALGALGLVSLAEDEAEARGSGIGRKAKKAKKRKKPKKCPPGRKRCGKRCCPKGKVCRNKKCVIKQPTPPPPPGCTPVTQAVACEGRECGTVGNGCAGTYECGTCTGPEICGPDGQCNCTPTQTEQEACAGRDCGTVANSCGGDYTCGPATCPGTNEQCLTGVCTCVPPQTQEQACGTNDCGTVPDGCGGDYTCGPATCAGTNDQCLAGHCTCVPPQTQQQACDGRECGTIADGCGSDYTCGTGTCPNLPCATAIACNEEGQCLYDTASHQGTSCNAGSGASTGMCVAGTCEATNTNPEVNCGGTNVCLGPPTKCGTGGNDCNCYSTWEGAGFCIQATQAICPAASVRPVCSSSAGCAAIEGHEESVCVSLKENPDSTSGCCSPQSDQFPGFCVPLAARCNA